MITKTVWTVSGADLGSDLFGAPGILLSPADKRALRGVPLGVEVRVVPASTRTYLAEAGSSQWLIRATCPEDVVSILDEAGQLVGESEVSVLWAKGGTELTAVLEEEAVFTPQVDGSWKRHQGRRL